MYFHFLPEESGKYSPDSTNSLSATINSQNIGEIISTEHSPDCRPDSPRTIRGYGGNVRKLSQLHRCVR